jgi:arylsulfatase A-like enzyme
MGLAAAESRTGAGMPGGVLLVTIDRLPAWIAGPWGATWMATPTLDLLAAQGITFDRVLTPATDPRRTAHDMFRGPHGLASACAARGWPLTVLTDQPAITTVALADSAADVVVVVPASGTVAVARDEAGTNAARLFAAAADAVSAGRHRAVWCHAGCLGSAWDAPEELRGMYVDPDDPPPPPGAAVPDMTVTRDTDPDLIVGLRHVFAAQVTLLDRCLASLLRAVDERAARDGAWAILVVGLRGMPLGIHDRLGGRPDPDADDPPFGEMVHVPAILVDPRRSMAAQRYGGLVTPADLAATLADLVAPQAVASAAGHPAEAESLRGLCDAWSVKPRDRVVIRGVGGDALATPGWHAVLRPGGDASRPLLFAKPDDFFETCDVADRERGVASELARALRRPETGQPDPAWIEPLSEAAAVSAV